MPTESSIFDALTAVQQDVLQALVAGQSISAAAELGGLTDLALDTFRHILSDDRLKAAMEIVKLVEAQRPTVRQTTLTEVQFDRVDRDLQLHQVAQTSQPAPQTPNVGRNAPCPCGSPLKYKRCCGNPAQAPDTAQARAA